MLSLQMNRDRTVHVLINTPMLSLQMKRVERLSKEFVACLGPGTAVECVGSSACGLSTQMSDIDLNVIRGFSHLYFTIPRIRPTDAQIC